MNQPVPGQLTDRSVLARLTPAEIVALQAAGHLDQLTGVPPEQVDLLHRARNGGTLTRADLARLNELGHPDLVLLADREDRITHTDTDRTHTL